MNSVDSNKQISASLLNGQTEIIDFDEIRREKTDINALDRDAENDLMLDSHDEEDAESEEGIFAKDADDPTRMFQYPLISLEKPPGGIPHQCQHLLLSQAKWYKILRSSFLVSERPLIQCGVIRGFLGLYHERFLHMTTHPYSIHPYSDFYTAWTYVSMFLLAITIIYEPYMIAFECENYVKHPARSVSLITSVTLLFDMALKFWVGYQDPYSLTVDLAPRSIAKAYLSGWFLFDICTRFPLAAIWIYKLPEEDLQDVTNLEAVRLLAFFTRVFRYKNVYHAFCRLSNTFSFKSVATPWVLKLTILIFFTLHWHACFHWLLPSIVNARFDEPKTMSWITNMEVWNAPKYIQYMNAYLKALSNLLTLDGGNFIPRETEEIFCTIIGIFISVSMYGYFISSFSTVSSELHASEEKYHEMLDLVEEYLKFQKIPDGLQHKVLQYFDKKYRGHIFSESAILATLSASLRTEVSCHNCRNLVEKVTMFNTLPKSVIVKIVERLVYEVYVPGDVIISPDTASNSMYFVQDGELEVLSSYGKRINFLRDGDFFGEDHLITNEKLTNSVVARTPCEVYSLSKEDFRECVVAYPDIYDEVLSMATDRLNADTVYAEEAARNAEKMRIWVQAKARIDRIVAQTNKFEIDESGIELINYGTAEDDEVEVDDDESGEDESGSEYDSQLTNKGSLKTRMTRMTRMTQKTTSTTATVGDGQDSFVKSPLKTLKNFFKKKN